MAGGAISTRKVARLPEIPASATRRRGLPLRHGTWSRSLDDPITFEEAVIAGRGSRQLPTVGPQQLASAGMITTKGRGRPRPVSGPRRELPRPGTTIGFTTVSGMGYPLKHQGSGGISESDDEDWC